MVPDFIRNLFSKFCSGYFNDVRPVNIQYGAELHSSDVDLSMFTVFGHTEAPQNGGPYRGAIKWGAYRAPQNGGHTGAP